MPLDRFFLSEGQALQLLYGDYNPALVALSIGVAILAGSMACQLAGMARDETRRFNRRISVLSGAFVLGAGVWSMHFIGMLAYSVCSTAHYDPLITALSMFPSFIASWIALMLLTREQVSRAQLLLSGIAVGAGIGVMHYSGMAAVHASLVLRFDPGVFGASIVLAVVLSILALWLRFGLAAGQRLSPLQTNILSGSVLGAAISGMHYTGMAAARFLPHPAAAPPEANLHLALLIAGATTLATLLTGGVNALLRYRTLFQRMAHNEARMRATLDTAVDGIITIDSRGIVRAFNGAAENIFGWTAGEVVGRNVNMLMPEPERSQHDDYLRNYQRSGIAKIIGTGRDVTGRRRDGTTFPLRLAIGKAALPDETLFVGFVTDISERRHMEEALRDSEQQYRSLIGNLPGIAFRCHLDAEWSMLFISDAVERLTGWAPQDFTSGRKHFVELLHPDDRAWVAATIDATLQADRPYQIEYRLLDRAGQEHWVSESASGIRGADGKIAWIDGVIIDISDTKQRNAEFESVVQALNRSVAVVEFALDGTIRNANPNFLALTGYALDELVDRHHSVLCAPGEADSEAYRTLWGNLRRGRHAAGDFHRIGKGGRDVWIHGSYSPILDPDGRPYKIIKFASDLAERHAMEQDLREAKTRAEQAADAKSTFLANMSHEIRTPMNAIIGFTDVLLEEPASDTQRRHLNVVRNSARSLLLLLNDILDTAKLERGALELEDKDFSLRELCQQVLASLRINAQAKGLPLLLDYPDREPEFFRGDALRIQQILLNLVGNAIKFTERGRVNVRVRQEAGGVHLVVSDTGIGIAPDRIARIFEPFAQADASMSRRFGGTGLGTTIARQLIELMHGRIRVESELGTGSHFHVELPLPAGNPVSEARQLAIPELPPLHLLVADDVPQNLELLQIMLGRRGHRLSVVSHGGEAVRACSEQTFDAILMDVQMPVMNGLDASREIRRIEAAAGRAPTPIIALTASVQEADAAAARAAGMNGFASKPVELRQLCLEIARLLDLPVTPAAPGAVQPPEPRAPIRGSVIDWSQGSTLWGSEQRHCAAIDSYLAESGDLAARLRQLLGDPAALAGELHRLKGAAANLALSRVAHLSRHIEQSIAAGELDDLPGQLDRLAEELVDVRETRQQLAATYAPSAPNAGPASAPEPALLRPALQSLAAALERGELAEAALAQLGKRLPADAFAPLDAAINAFDFDAARQIVGALQQRYSQEGNTP